MYFREIGSNKASSSHCPIALPGTSECENRSNSCLPRDMYSVTRGNQGFDVVEIRPPLPLLLPNIEARSFHSDNFRCLPARLGSSLPTQEDGRTMDSGRGSEPHQLLGTEGNLLGLQCFLKESVSVSVLIRMDNWMAISYLNPDGEPISISTLPAYTGDMELVSCSSGNYSCKVPPRQQKHNSRPGVEAPSRQQQLAPVPCSIWCIESPIRSFLYGSICFQDELPTLHWRPDPGALAADGFSISWAWEFPYLFPPFCLVGRALLKSQRETVTCACLIAPAWPTQVWYPQLLAMLTDLPILLPDHEDLLLSPDHRSHSYSWRGACIWSLALSQATVWDARHF